MVNPRDIAGERRRRRWPPGLEDASEKHSREWTEQKGDNNINNSSNNNNHRISSSSSNNNNKSNELTER